MSKRKIATIVGVLILTAYLMLFGEATDSKPIVLLLEVISGLSVIGIAVLLYPLFKSYNKTLSVGYLSFKLLEGLLMITGGVLYLNNSTQHFRSDIYEYVHIYPFIIGAFLLYSLFYKSKLIPRFISIWGFIAVAFLSLITILKWFGYSNQILDYTLVLMITNEIFLAGWLIVKGFDYNSDK